MIKSLLYLTVASVVLLFFIQSFEFGISYILAFVSSLIIVFGSYYGFYSKVKSSVGDFNTIDEIDKIEDPFDLYSLDIDSDDTKDFKEIIKNQKQMQKGRAFLGIKHSKPMFSIYRLAGYGVLVLSFFYLLNHDILNIYGFLLGVGVGSIGLGSARFLAYK
jgi:hypothetical protein